jgi:DNA-binding response OmpR family regulator
VAADADYVIDDIAAALGGPDVSFTVCRDGRDVSPVVKQRTPDLVVLDLQIGSMGGMAVTMSLRLDESSGALPHVKVLMLLDRRADVHLAKRCAADGYLVKPLDPLKLKLAARAILSPPAPPPTPAAVETPEEEPAAVG